MDYCKNGEQLDFTSRYRGGEGGRRGQVSCLRLRRRSRAERAEKGDADTERGHMSRAVTLETL